MRFLIDELTENQAKARLARIEDALTLAQGMLIGCQEVIDKLKAENSELWLENSCLKARLLNGRG